jgi:hypothetical protein
LVSTESVPPPGFGGTINEVPIAPLSSTENPPLKSPPLLPPIEVSPEVKKSDAEDEEEVSVLEPMTFPE